MTTAQDFAAAALALVGTPWHHQGRLPGVGLDCVGVAVCAAQACGIAVQDVRDYTLPADPNTFLRLLSANCKRDVEPMLAAGRLAVFRIGQHPQHLAVMVDSDRMVHGLDRKRRAVVLDALTDPWRQRVHSTWLIRGIA